MAYLRKKWPNLVLDNWKVVTNFLAKTVTQVLLFSGVTVFNSLSADFESMLMPRSASYVRRNKLELYSFRLINLLFCSFVQFGLKYSNTFTISITFWWHWLFQHQYKQSRSNLPKLLLTKPKPILGKCWGLLCCHQINWVWCNQLQLPPHLQFKI